MGLAREHVAKISLELQEQGVTFKSLESELLDHLICDVEGLMGQGQTFEQALAHIKQDIPKNHFKIIQNETMELINQKMKPVRIAGIFSLGLLILATLFKSLHLPGTGQLLLGFLLSACVTLMIGSNRTIYAYPNHSGKLAVIGVTTALVTLIAGVCFKILHLPGANPLLMSSVVGLGILFPLLAIYFYAKGPGGRNHMLINLLDEFQVTIERTALVLVCFGLVFNYSDLLFGYGNGIGVFFFIFSVLITGIYVYTVSWKYYTEHEEKSTSDLLLLISSSIAFIMFILPAGQILPFGIRHVSAYGNAVIFSLIVFAKYAIVDRTSGSLVPAAFSGFLLFYPLLRLGIKLQWFEGWLADLTTNRVFILGFLALLLVMLWAYRKHTLFRLLIILTIASHMIPTL
ncbi:MAG: hypothetical protein AAGA85_18380 [Bacteroidota bacterium]